MDNFGSNHRMTYSPDDCGKRSISIVVKRGELVSAYGELTFPGAGVLRRLAIKSYILLYLFKFNISCPPNKNSHGNDAGLFISFKISIPGRGGKPIVIAR